MASVLVGGSAVGSLAASSTRYAGVGQGASNFSPTESIVQVTWRATGTFSLFWMSINTYDRASGTGRFRVATANGNQLVTVTAAGLVQDTTHTDTTSAGQALSISLTTGSGGTTCTFREYGAIFAASSNTVTKLVNNNGATSAFNNLTKYAGLGETSQSNFAWTGTEADAQYKFLISATFGNLYCNIATNTRTNTCTLSLRIAGATVNSTISITASTVGVLEDTTHTDAVVSGNQCNYILVFGADAGSLVFNSIAIEVSSTAGQEHCIMTGCGGFLQAANLTEYYPFGNLVLNTTESLCQQLATLTGTYSNMAARASANSVSATSTLTFRKNTAAGNQVVTWASNTAGSVEDTTHTDVMVATDVVNLQLITGATGTNLNLTNMGLLWTTPAVMANIFGLSFLDGLSAAGPIQFTRVA